MYATAAAINATPALAIDLRAPRDRNNLSAGVNANLKARLHSNDIDARSVSTIDVGADGSVEVYEG